MQILKKKSTFKTTNNYLNIYKFYLKNLNFFNNFKKRNNILIKDILLLKLNDLYLLNINSKDNFFFSNIEENKNYYKNKNNLLYFLSYYDNYLKKIKINTNYSNIIYEKKYIEFLNKKLKKFFIRKFFIQKKNKINKFYFTKFNLYHPKLKGFVLKRVNKKYVKIAFLGKIKKIKNKFIYKKEKDYLKNIKNIYLRKRLKLKYSFFYNFKTYFKGKTILFNFKIKLSNKKNKFKLIYYRKKYIIDIKKNIYLKKKIKKLQKNIYLKKKLKNFNKYIFLKKLKNSKKIYNFLYQKKKNASI